jgi:hypothetical protein
MQSTYWGELTITLVYYMSMYRKKKFGRRRKCVVSMKVIMLNKG